MSYAVAGYLATAVALGGYLAWVVVRSREVAAQLLSAAGDDDQSAGQLDDADTRSPSLGTAVRP